MQMKQCFSIFVLAGLTLSLPGCVLEDVPPENIGGDQLTFEERLSQEHREPQAGIGIGDGEIPLGPEALVGTYIGTIRGDHGTVATLTATFSGPPERVTADISITEGLVFACYALYQVGAQSFTLTLESSQGSRHILTGSVNVEDRTIGIWVDADLHGAQLNGSAYVDGPMWCDRFWPFELSRI